VLGVPHRDQVKADEQQPPVRCLTTRQTLDASTGMARAALITGMMLEHDLQLESVVLAKHLRKPPARV
jgi:hypothetical protein